MKLGSVIRRSVLALVILGLAIGLATGSAIGGPPADRPERPPAAAQERLATVREYREVGVTFAPPHTDQQPGISAEKAVELAWNDAVGDGASEAQPIFAIVTDDTYGITRKGPVWIVRYPGMCVPGHGSALNPRPAGSCVGTGWVVVLDAQTGEYLTSFNET